jgi:two-component system response regulator AtoC
MDTISGSTGNQAAVELQSLVDSHDSPFVVIDRDYQIVAVNEAYRKHYGIKGHTVIGCECFRISHHNSVPCCELGEECPHATVFDKGTAGSCIHVHYDQDYRMQQVRVRAFPLRGANGERYLGELIEEIAIPQHPFPASMRMVGNAMSFRNCLEHLKLAAATHPPVLLQGETGTGKELAARYIHDHSPRRDKPFVTVDCRMLADTLVEAEMFGHTHGAYTDSVGEKPGLFEAADGGTLFLDEIGVMPMSQQTRLLRILDTGQVRRAGGRGMRSTDVRIVCATSHHLWNGVKAGQFREDLYYRIAGLAVRLPPLRERMEDIDVLAHSLLESIGESRHRQYRLTEDAMARLRACSFPGNIRDLWDILCVAVTRSTAQELDGAIIDQVVRQLESSRATQPDVPGGRETPGRTSVTGERADRVVSLQENEARHVTRLLQQFDGNRRLVAASLGISERTLYRKLRRYSLS